MLCHGPGLALHASVICLAGQPLLLLYKQVLILELLSVVKQLYYLIPLF